MVVLITILAWIVAGLFAVILLLLVTPIHLWFWVRAEGGVQYGLDLRLLSGRLPRLLRISGDTSATSKAKGPKVATAKPKKKKERRKKPGNGTSSARSQVRTLIGELPRTVADTLRAIHIDLLRVRGEFGLSDPADTGRLWGVLVPFQYARLLPALAIDVRPNFEGPVLNGAVDARLHVVPVRLILPAIGLLWRVYLWPK